ncbi:tail fiber assembly protein [Enterobacter kobei]|uniref:tail fiber assembly protein n=1 Tax=Enterobacter kobei TaxID=208224 RepID=UPI001C70896C|nr:tail fiber assembly protein [Enterobacter kobei]MBW9428686.1 tail fiber assembly protein [Enterobacter kobei]
MAGLFDKNGNATETHIATVSGFAPETGEHLSTYDVRILAGTGIPGSSTLTLAPDAQSGHAVCWNGESWSQVLDLRGTTAYEKATGAPATVKNLGPLSEELTTAAPATPYDKWDGDAWVTDTVAQAAAEITLAEQQRAALLAVANVEISWRQDAVDADIATEQEVSELADWKKYRVLLMRADIAKPDWPTTP